jgi:hypothetical protein
LLLESYSTPQRFQRREEAVIVLAEEDYRRRTPPARGGTAADIAMELIMLSGNRVRPH